MKGFFYGSQQGGANDAAAPPELSQACEIQFPSLFLGNLLDQLKSLCVGNNFRPVQRLFHFSHKIFLFNINDGLRADKPGRRLQGIPGGATGPLSADRSLARSA